ERDQGGEPTLALGGDPVDGPVHGRDLLSQRAGRGLRQGQGLRVLLLRPAADHHRRNGIADQSAGDKVAFLSFSPQSGEKVPRAAGPRRMRGNRATRRSPSPGSQLCCSPPSPRFAGRGEKTERVSCPASSNAEWT